MKGIPMATTTTDRIARMLAWCETLGVKPLPLATTNDKTKADGAKYGGKAPVGKDWGLRDHTAAEFVYHGPMTDWVKEGDMRCVGFQLGPPSGGLMDIDLDSEAACDRAGEFFGDLQPVEYGRGGVRTHIMLRATDIPDDIAAKYTGFIGEQTAIELRTGCGETKDGDPIQLQSMILGHHPDTGEKLHFIGDSPQAADDFPTVPFSDILARFTALCDAIDARKVWVKSKPRKLNSTRSSYTHTDLAERIRQELPPLSQVCAEYAGDSPDGKGNQQCPVCQNGGNPVLSVDDTAGQAYCFWDGCETRSWGSRGGFDVFHLIGNMEGLTDFRAVLKHAAARAGFPWEADQPDRTKLRAADKKKAKEEQSQTKKAELAERRELSARTIAGSHLYLHGELYTTFDNKTWTPCSDHQMKLKLRDEYSKYVSPTLMGELDALTRAYATPPADSPELCPPEHHGASININTGELLTGTAFQNAVVSVDDSGQLHTAPRQLHEMYVNALPHIYSTEDIPTPIWMKFMYEFARGVVGDDRAEQETLIATIHTMIGAAIFDNRLEKMWLLYGKGGSGKGVILRVLRAIVGARNWYATTLQSMSSRFEIANMRHKKVVCLPEMEYRPWKGEEEYNRSMDTCKKITGRDAVGVEIKYQQFAYDAELNCALVAASNSLTAFPRDGEEGSAWGRRLIVIPTPPPVAKPDPSLAQKIISTELQGIINNSIGFFCDALAAGSVPLCHKSQQLIYEATESRWSSFCLMFEKGTEDDIIFNTEFRHLIADFLEMDYDKVKQGHTNQGKKALRDTYSAQILDKPIHNAISGKVERGISGIRLKA